MKRLICLLLVIVLTGSVVGCGAKEDKESVLDIFEKYDSEMNEADIRKMHPDAYEFDPISLVVDDYYYNDCNGSLVFTFDDNLIAVTWTSTDTLEDEQVCRCWVKINKELNWKFGKSKTKSFALNQGDFLQWRKTDDEYSLRPTKKQSLNEHICFQKTFDWKRYL